MNKLTELFKRKQQNLLALYFTAGYPKIEDMPGIIAGFESSEADILEIGIPFSDPMADGPVIQKSGQQALENGMTVGKMFEILKEIKTSKPLVVMSYFNPIFKFGVEEFCKRCKETGIDGMIIPDLPFNEFDKSYKKIFDQHGLSFIPLVTDKTNDERLQKAIEIGSGFLYLASAHITTGSNSNMDFSKEFKVKIRQIQNQIPVMIGFGIGSHTQFIKASSVSNGAIVGSAFIRVLENTKDAKKETIDFTRTIKRGIP
jgi:tryptophan synthase alpha chain